jgi:uncharacterized OsmC-like protein
VAARGHHRPAPALADPRRDCADCETREGQFDRIDSTISLAGALSDEQRTRLLEIAEKCPVHRTLTSEISIKTRLG